MAGFEWEVELDDDVDVPNGQEQPPLHEQPDPSTFDVDPEQLEKELDAALGAGISIDLNAFFRTAAGFKLAYLWFTKKKRAKLNAKIARLRRHADQKAHDEGGRLARAGTWNPQNSPGELDVPRTFTSHGTFIPGVTTQRVKARPDPKGRPRSQKFSHMNFLIDVSSSMSQGVSPTHPLDVRVKEGPAEPWKVLDPAFSHTHAGLWGRHRPLMPDPRGPGRGYPRFEVRVPVGFGLPNEGSVIDPTDIRRVSDVAVEISYAMLHEARKRKNTVSIISFDTLGRLELPKTRDYAKAEKTLLLLEPSGGTDYSRALDIALEETKRAGGKAMTILVTDALMGDLLTIAPGATETATDADPNNPQSQRTRMRMRSAIATMHALVKAGPFFLVCLGQDPDNNPDLKQMLAEMRERYGSNFTVGAFPDVTSEDAVFTAARWSVRL